VNRDKTYSLVAAEGRLAKTSIGRGDFEEGVSIKWEKESEEPLYTKSKVKELKIEHKRLQKNTYKKEM